MDIKIAFRCKKVGSKPVYPGLESIYNHNDCINDTVNTIIGDYFEFEPLIRWINTHGYYNGAYITLNRENLTNIRASILATAAHPSEQMEKFLKLLKIKLDAAPDTQWISEMRCDW